VLCRGGKISRHRRLLGRSDRGLKTLGIKHRFLRGPHKGTKVAREFRSSAVY
jgi:hypothetical protein